MLLLLAYICLCSALFHIASFISSSTLMLLLLAYICLCSALFHIVSSCTLMLLLLAMQNDEPNPMVSSQWYPRLARVMCPVEERKSATLPATCVQWRRESQQPSQQHVSSGGGKVSNPPSNMCPVEEGKSATLPATCVQWRRESQQPSQQHVSSGGGKVSNPPHTPQPVEEAKLQIHIVGTGSFLQTSLASVVSPHPCNLLAAAHQVLEGQNDRGHLGT